MSHEPPALRMCLLALNERAAAVCFFCYDSLHFVFLKISIGQVQVNILLLTNTPGYNPSDVTDGIQGCKGNSEGKNSLWTVYSLCK